MAAKALLEFEVGHPLKAVVTRPNYNAQGKHVPNAQGNWTGNHFAKLAADKHGYFVKKLRSISVFDSGKLLEALQCKLRRMLIVLMLLNFCRHSAE